MSNWWSEKAQADAAQKRQEQEDAFAEQMTYRNNSLGPWAMAAVERRRAEVARNKAAEAAVGVGMSVGERMQREAQLRALQHYGVTAEDLEARPSAVYQDIR
ncbi:hypothetical protein ABT213_06075 [Streptomyces sp. NPDC001674]|uniref:hypothetical protein n=1 Tax=Streptomyces sp. NPDC001674 TaxID=3154394 RepID=UPI00332774AC